MSAARICLLAVLLVGCGSSPGGGLGNELPKVPPKLMVVGDYYADDGKRGLNTAQGETMKLGVQWAISHHPWGPDETSALTVEYPNDHGDPAEAAEIARTIALDPAVLAVIGHATSGTTAAAAPFYARAGIPFLVPGASSPKALCASEDTAQNGCVQYPNCFRLIPNDRDVQAPSVALAVAKKKCGKPYLLVDVSDDAREYAENLADEVEKYFKEDALYEDYKRVDIEPDAELSQIADVIKDFQADAVVFCGYKENAERLLAQLAKKYPQGPKPKVFLTDGCLAEDLETSGFPEVFVTFARSNMVCPGLRKTMAENPRLVPKEAEYLIEKAGASDVIALQEYSYDAVRMVTGAAEACRREEKVISRSCVLRRLQTTPQFVGACDVYSIAGGENQFSEYYLHDFGPERKDPERLDPKEIRRFSRHWRRD